MMSYSEEIVSVGVPGSGVHRFTKLQRHILYCLDEQRDMSVKYGPELAALAYQNLSERGFVTPLDASSWGLTDLGKAAVKALRERPR